MSGDRLARSVEFYIPMLQDYRRYFYTIDLQLTEQLDEAVRLHVVVNPTRREAAAVEAMLDARFPGGANARVRAERHLRARHKKLVSAAVDMLWPTGRPDGTADELIQQDQRIAQAIDAMDTDAALDVARENEEANYQRMVARWAVLGVDMPEVWRDFEALSEETQGWAVRALAAASEGYNMGKLRPPSRSDNDTSPT